MQDGRRFRLKVTGTFTPNLCWREGRGRETGRRRENLKLVTFTIFLKLHSFFFCLNGTRTVHVQDELRRHTRRDNVRDPLLSVWQRSFSCHLKVDVNWLWSGKNQESLCCNFGFEVGKIKLFCLKGSKKLVYVPFPVGIGDKTIKAFPIRFVHYSLLPLRPRRQYG